jgi:hypothetical protein
MSTRSLVAAQVISAILFSFLPAWAQESRATVVGRVTDSSGAVIPAATVSLTNLETGVTVKTETNAEGNYFSSFLIPGQYRITAEKSGFKSLVRSGITEHGLSIAVRPESPVLLRHEQVPGTGFRGLGPFLLLSERSAAEWFNASVFNRNAAQQLADNLVTLSPTVGHVRSSAYNSSDTSLLKPVTIHEKVRLEIRGDFLNVFNQVSFAAPNVTPTSSAFGTVTAQMNVPRRIQAMLRLQF